MRILVQSHIDDEMLWHNPDNFDRIIIVFRDRYQDPIFNQNRMRALSNHPLREKIICFNYEESGIVDKNSILDIGIRKNRFLENWHKLELDLAKFINQSQYPIEEIYTHNRWGEFGHPEHVMINAVVNMVANKIPIYCRENLIGSSFETGWYGVKKERFNFTRFLELRDYYIKYNIWTFKIDYLPNNVIKYYRESPAQFKRRRTKIII